ncbi:MAG: AI-2E family transporter [Candidatus Nealsonbacteria bacterium]|nr:MAG: AI-2E family transporter [Candidatus Nealsonbacteria bacterium]
MDEERVLDISWGTFLKIAIVFLGFYILYSIKDILLWILFGFIISILFNPAINFLQRRRVPRTIATIFVYVTVFAILTAIFYWTIPIFIFEIQQFTQLFPQYFEKLAPPLRGLNIEEFESFETFTQALQDWLIRASSSIFGAVISIFGGIFSTVTIFAIAIFFSIEEKEVKRVMELLAPKRNEAFFLDLWERCQTKTASWFGARALSSLFVGLITYITLRIFGIEYAFVLGLFAGIMDIIPVLGPIFSGLIIIILVALNYPPKAFLILIALVLIQQIEGNVITPVLTKKMVGLPAILVLIALLIGGKLWGFLGAILTIPLTGVIYEFLRDFLKKRKEEQATML